MTSLIVGLLVFPVGRLYGPWPRQNGVIRGAGACLAGPDNFGSHGASWYPSVWEQVVRGEVTHTWG